MWPTTSLSQLLNIRLPIIQAPMAGDITTPALVSAVSNAGGLGELGAAYTNPAQIKKDIQAMIKTLESVFQGCNIPSFFHYKYARRATQGDHNSCSAH